MGRGELVVSALEVARDVRHPRLDPLCARIPDVREPLGEHRLGLSGERAHCAVQLTGESFRRVLT